MVASKKDWAVAHALYSGIHVDRNVLTRFLTWGTGTIRPGGKPMQVCNEREDFPRLQESYEEKD
jgi:hypothetical protein